MELMNLVEGEKAKGAIDSLVKEVAAASEPLTSAQPADPAKKDLTEKALKDVAAFRGRPLFFDYISSGIGHGPYVKLIDGSVKLDLINGIGVHILGHSHPQLIESGLKSALSDAVNQGHLQAGDEYKRMGEKLISLAKGTRLEHCWLSTCGTMANENALKMSRQKNSPANMVMAMKDAFSGRSTMMAEITDNPNYKVGLPDYNEVLRVPFYDKKDPEGSKNKALESIRRHIAEHPKMISTFCFEPVLGEGGYRTAPRDYYIPLFEECKKNGIAVWADEVQTFLRTGEPFAFQTIGFEDYVDICSIAKTAQIGATLYTSEYNPKPGLIAGTFAGSTAALSAGLTAIDVLESGQYFGENGRIAGIHNKFISELSKLSETTCKGYLEDPDGLGLMVAVTPFSGDKAKVIELIKKLFSNGLMCFGCGKDPFRIRFLVPAIITDAQIEEAMSILEKTILEMKG